MSLHSIQLKEFVQTVPICREQESLKTVLSLLHHCNRDRLVLVSSQQQPLGLVRLSELLPHILESMASAALPLINRSLIELLAAISPSIVLPLVPLPEHWSLAQFFASHPLSDEQAYGVVDQQGQFVGLLDRDRLLTYLAESVVAPTSDEADEADQHSQQQQIVALTQQLLVQRAELEQRIKAQQEEIAWLKQPLTSTFRSDRSAPNAPPPASSLPLKTSTSLLNALLQLVERLPLPLMLQTNEGNVLAQNAVWCQQVGELSDPAKIWREAAVWLGTPGHMPGGEAIPQPEGKSPSSKLPLSTELPIQAGAIAPLPFPQNSSPDEQNLCQVGAHPDSCICVCPLKDGREQVVQFVKIPLGTLVSDLQLDWADANTLPADTVSHQPSEAVPATFQLAALVGSHQNSASELEQQTKPGSRASAEQLDRPPTASLRSLWLVMAQDVTQQQHLAKELTAKNADLVQLNRLKDEFLACISHELKTPLTAVLGLSSLLKDQTLGTLNPRQVHYVQLIHQSSRHLMSIVNDILDLTRIETGQLELLYGTVDIPTLCNRAFEQAKQVRLSDGKYATSDDDEVRTEIRLDVEPGLTTLVADDLRLRQMLVHLLSNALKFTEEDNPIGLRVNCWGGWIAFTVWDTGIGIPADKQHLIFQKFQQLENPLTRRFEGAGLGLVLTRRLARLHGGDVSFLSKEGAGSQFTILLPPTPPDRTQLTRGAELDDEADTHAPALHYPGGRVPLYAHPTTAHPTGATSPNGRDRLVLIVDAVSQFVESLAEKLTGIGYRVVIARSGTEALEKARRLQPDVVFLNPLLPLLSGWDVLTLLKSGAETRHLPVVLTATVIDEERAYQNQADGFLTLPVQPQKLQTLLQQLISGSAKRKTWAPLKSLTILHLSSSSMIDGEARSLSLTELLRSQRYRILESDDLGQADLLAEVWQPNVVLLDGTIAHPTTYLQQLSHHAALASLPIVIMDAQMAQAANQIAGLQVFPCLLHEELNASNATDVSTLLQVIQIAAGCVWQPFVLAVDISTLPEFGEGQDFNQRLIDPLGDAPQETEWLQALMQYLQTARIEGMVAQSWQEVWQQLDSERVDLLLMCWTHGEPQTQTLKRLTQLKQRRSKPPIIVLDHRDPELGDTTLIPLPEQVRSLATHTLSPPIAMSELLEHIQHTLKP